MKIHEDIKEWCYMLNLSVVYKTHDNKKPTLMRFLGIRDFKFCASEFIVIFCGNGERKYLSRKYILEMTSTEANRDVTTCRKITRDRLGLPLMDYKEIHFVEQNKDRECWSEDWTIQDFIKLNVDSNNRSIEAHSKRLEEMKDYLSQIERTLKILKEDKE